MKAPAMRTLTILNSRGESPEHKPGAFVPVFDTREQDPWLVAPDVPWLVAKLDAGDVSVAGFESSIVIERKSLDDFAGTVTAGHERFRRELLLLQTYAFAAVVVEGTVADVLAHRYRSRIEPTTLLKIAATIEAKYKIAVHFVGGRAEACAYAMELLRSAWKLAKGGKA